jgi:hypothetical protein
MVNNKLLQFYPDIFQPTSLMSEAMPATSMEYMKRSAQHPQRATCLVFSTQAGKKDFRDLVRRREKRAKKAAYDRAYRAKMKLRKEQEQTILM